MTRIEEIKKKISELYDALSKEESKFDFNRPYSDYEAMRQPFTEKIGKLDRELRLIKPYELGEEVGGRDHIMSLENFIEAVNDGMFIDYDGFGLYVKDNKETDIEIYPSDVHNNSLRNEFDTIVWFNR